MSVMRDVGSPYASWLLRWRQFFHAKGRAMRRWGTFACGVVVGGALIYSALNYHIIHAKDGLHLVPKVNAQLAGFYVDIRGFAPRDWADHPEIFAALSAAHRDDLIQSAAGDAVRNGLDRLLGTEDANR
jgi:hypothetical protein